MKFFQKELKELLEKHKVNILAENTNGYDKVDLIFYREEALDVENNFELYVKGEPTEKIFGKDNYETTSSQ